MAILLLLTCCWAANSRIHVCSACEISSAANSQTRNEPCGKIDCTANFPSTLCALRHTQIIPQGPRQGDRCGMAIVVIEGAPAAKRRKKSKCAPAHAAVEAVPAAPVAKQHAAADNKPKRKKKAWKRISRAVDEVAAQPDAPAALPSPPAAAPPTGLAARLSAPSLAGSKKGKGALHDCKQHACLFICS